MPMSIPDVSRLSISEVLQSLTEWNVEADVIGDRYSCQEYDPANQAGMRHIGYDEARSAAKIKALINTVQILQFQKELLEGGIEKPSLLSPDQAVDKIQKLTHTMVPAQELNDETPIHDVLMGDIPPGIIDEAKRGCQKSQDFLTDIQEVRKYAIAQICRARLSLETDISEISVWEYADAFSFSKSAFSVFLGNRDFHVGQGDMPETTFLVMRATYIRRNLKLIATNELLFRTL